METAEKLEGIRTKARQDREFCEKLLSSRDGKDPLKSFCAAALENGFDITPWELVTFGEESYAEMKRSTNGGGENSPLLEWSDDYYELIMAELETIW